MQIGCFLRLGCENNSCGILLHLGPGMQRPKGAGDTARSPWKRNSLDLVFSTSSYSVLQNKIGKIYKHCWDLMYGCTPALSLPIRKRLTCYQAQVAGSSWSGWGMRGTAASSLVPF